jgi:hypothetical protein
MKRLEAKWLSYRTVVIPKDAGELQVRESRRAFYAGAGALLETILGFLGSGDEPSEQELASMDQIANEIREFNEQVKRGAA